MENKSTLQLVDETNRKFDSATGIIGLLYTASGNLNEVERLNTVLDMLQDLVEDAQGAFNDLWERVKEAKATMGK